MVRCFSSKTRRFFTLACAELTLFLTCSGAIDTTAAGWPEKNVVRVLPRGGTLVVFDSKLIHEVTPSLTKQRRALTIWIGCPVANGARGEGYDAGELS